MAGVSANPLLSVPPPVTAGRKRGGGRQSLLAATEETEGTKQKTNFKTSSLYSSITVWDLLPLSFSTETRFLLKILPLLLPLLLISRKKVSTLKRRKTATPL